jgi:diadenosine tetraphosphate (Ap4A) HIT family hydrolase
MNPTIENFEFPGSLICEYSHWVVLLRPRQVTLGSLVLAHKGDQTRPGDVFPEAYAELSQIKTAIENTLRSAFGMQKINYLMLMMVDKEVHYHVIPRYPAPVNFQGVEFEDTGWPAIPQLGYATELDAETHAQLLQTLKDKWPAND